VHRPGPGPVSSVSFEPTLASRSNFHFTPFWKVRGVISNDIRRKQADKVNMENRPWENWPRIFKKTVIRKKQKLEDYLKV
jgi:hypothetical protein